ncbi:hypothetical protein RRG08_022487 [Elysia crispata]|uniref:Uncharacterized protein n=1 Tax=Elysia crispata TaxID=231223 RepID=A0AAE1D981_9GAST|nr:hypothetical protein RRG08_022487 [Elysia crispata]
MRVENAEKSKKLTMLAGYSKSLHKVRNVHYRLTAYFVHSYVVLEGQHRLRGGHKNKEHDDNSYQSYGQDVGGARGLAVTTEPTPHLHGEIDSPTKTDIEIKQQHEGGVVPCHRPGPSIDIVNCVRPANLNLLYSEVQRLQAGVDC